MASIDAVIGWSTNSPKYLNKTADGVSIGNDHLLKETYTFFAHCMFRGVTCHGTIEIYADGF